MLVEVVELVVIENLLVQQIVIQLVHLKSCVSALSLPATTYPITVGGGGPGVGGLAHPVSPSSTR